MKVWCGCGHGHGHGSPTLLLLPPQLPPAGGPIPPPALVAAASPCRRRIAACGCGTTIRRREALVWSGAAGVAYYPGRLVAGEEAEEEAADTTITDEVYVEIAVCPRSFMACGVGAETLGRVVMGLYGRQVPQTVANFKAMCTGAAGSTYHGTIIHRVIPGHYIQAGRQGSREKGEVLPPSHLHTNPETVSPASFQLRHAAPGTLSLCLSENDDDDAVKLRPNYRNVEFLITTGPGPAPQLDLKNIVLGRVIEGLDVISAVAAVPVYKPNERIRQLNDLARLLGDKRASNARSFWYHPLKALYISDCGEVQTPVLQPLLP